MLNIGINFPPGVGAATVVNFDAAGNPVATLIPLDANGDAAPVAFPFAAGVQSKLVVVITNAGNQFICNQATVFSCSGLPQNDYSSGFNIMASAT